MPYITRINRSINQKFKSLRLNNQTKRLLLVCVAIFLLIFIHSIYKSVVESINQSTLGWMDDREASVLIKHIYRMNDELHNNGQQVRMLEFGSGKSSFALSRHTALYVSIEHDLTWCNQLIDQSKLVQDQHISISIYHSINRSISLLYDNGVTFDAHRLHFFYVLPNQPRDEQSTDWWMRLKCRYMRCPTRLHQFIDYVRMPEILYEKYDWKWDVVFVDGRARPQSAYYVIPYLSINQSINQSIVILHDWNHRKPYHIIERWYDIIDAQYSSYQPGGGGLIVGRVKTGMDGENDKELTDMPEWWY